MSAAAAATKKPEAKGQPEHHNPIRLYTRAKILGFQRANHSQNPNVTLLKIEGVEKREDTDFYLGKRVAYVYRGRTSIKGTKVRVSWGKIARPHGNSGVVRARFRKNLNPRTMGATVRVMLYPSNI